MRQWRVRLDAGLCIGSGLCLGIAPKYFEMGPDHRTALRATVVTADDAVIDAAACCPVEAITAVAIESDGSGLAGRME